MLCKESVYGNILIILLHYVIDIVEKMIPLVLTLNIGL